MSPKSLAAIWNYGTDLSHDLIMQQPKLGHYSLYFLMAGLIITGISMASFASDPIIVFGIDLAFAAHNQNTFFIIRGFHEFCTNAIIALIVIHILAALYHQFFAKDDTTLNMLKFWTTKKV